MVRAAVAGLVTALTCLPALMMSAKLPGTVWVMWPLLYWCALMLWAFVFAWHFEYSGRPVFQTAFKPKLWLGATAYALAAGVLYSLFVDPALRRLVPAEYPAGINAWLVACPFQILFAPLFICFAPFAFFMRLTHRQTVATSLTVVVSLFIAYLRLRMLPTLPPIHITGALLVMRAVSGFLSVYFYLNGGALLIWWVALLIQVRLLFEIVAAH